MRKTGRQGLQGRLARQSLEPACAEGAEFEVEAMYRERYSGFTAKHFRENLIARHAFSWGCAWTKMFLQPKWLLEKAKRRGAHRRKGPRRPLPGGAGLSSDKRSSLEKKLEV